MSNKKTIFLFLLFSATPIIGLILNVSVSVKWGAYFYLMIFGILCLLGIAWVTKNKLKEVIEIICLFAGIIVLFSSIFVVLATIKERHERVFRLLRSEYQKNLESFREITNATTTKEFDHRPQTHTLESYLTESYDLFLGEELDNELQFDLTQLKIANRKIDRLFQLNTAAFAVPERLDCKQTEYLYKQFHDLRCWIDKDVSPTESNVCWSNGVPIVFRYDKCFERDESLKNRIEKRLNEDLKRD